MKKKGLTLLMVFALAITSVLGARAYIKAQEPIVIETVSDTLEEENREEDKLALTCKAAVLMDGDSGTLIYSKNAHKELPPASVTKIMTMLLALEACEEERVSLSDKVVISEYAASMGGSQMYMEAGEEHTLEELLKGMAIASANDAAVATAEYIYGSEEIFVEEMNKRAKELGMADTNFVNVNGLPVANHLTSAYDIGVMSVELLKHPKVREYLSTWQETITVGLPGKEKEFTLTNTNKLLKSYSGAFGIKTGFTAEAGFCLSAGASKGDTTLVAVVLGGETSKSRNAEITKLLNHGFSTYESKLLLTKGEALKKVSLPKGEPETLNAICGADVKAFVKKGEEKEVTYNVVIDENLKLPLEKNAVIGKVIVYKGKEKLAEYPVLSERKVSKIPITTYYIRKIKNLF